MLFTSYEFIGFMLLSFAVYYMVPKRMQWKTLLIISYLFYALAGAKYIVYIVLTTLSTYLIGRKMDAIQKEQALYLKENKKALSREERKAYKAVMKKRNWKWLLLCLFFNFGILAVVKYANFTIGNINWVLHSFGVTNSLGVLDLVLPLGISFYTFQTMGYIIDVYRGKYEAEKNLGRLALFVSFFPQLMQGPISRFDDLSETMFNEHSIDLQNVIFGMERILWGYFKKLVVADRLLIAVKTLIGDPTTYGGSYVLVGMVFYAFQLYGDFTGGIDITIGIAQVFGIKVKENFEQPYFSKGITEYWRRWHITLGTWFKEYLFYPISVCQPMLSLSKKSRKRFGDAIGKRIPVYIATIVVWFITGFWHGAAWHFIIWGLMNCLVILISQECIPLYEKFHHRFPGLREKWYYRFFMILRTFLLMSSLRMFDCYCDVGLTFRMFGTMFTNFSIGVFWDGSLLELGLSGYDYIVLFIAIALIILVSTMQVKGYRVRERIALSPTPARYMVWYALFMSIVIFGAYGIGYDASQFIYNQF